MSSYDSDRAFFETALAPLYNLENDTWQPLNNEGLDEHSLYDLFEDVERFMDDFCYQHTEDGSHLCLNLYTREGEADVTVINMDDEDNVELISCYKFDTLDDEEDVRQELDELIDKAEGTKRISISNDPNQFWAP